MEACVYSETLTLHGATFRPQKSLQNMSVLQAVFSLRDRNTTQCLKSDFKSILRPCYRVWEIRTEKFSVLVSIYVAVKY